MGFVEASRTGGILILTHRRNLVDQFLGELHDRGYGKRESPPLLDGAGTERSDGPVTVETYQWFVRNAGRISDAYTIVICDEAHTALGEKTSAAIRAWTGPIFIGMTATGALIARHVTDLFPTQTSRFDLAQAARRGVIAPLRCIRIPPGPGVRTIAKVPLRRGDVDVEFDQEMLAELLDQLPFNMAIADLYKTRFNGVPGVVYAAGVRHAYNVAEAFREEGIKAKAVSGETPKRELAEILADYERGEIDVLVNAQLLAEGWNSPRATVCMHLAPTASKRIYQQRVGRVTRRHPGKEAGIVVDFVHPATKHDDPVVTLHSLLDRDVYRGGAIVVGPVRRGRGRRVRVERRVIPVTRRGGAPSRGLRARAVADRRRAPRLRRAAHVGGAGRRARRAQRLAPRAGDAALRPAPASSSAASCSPPSSATATRSCACARCRRSPRPRTPRPSTCAIDVIGTWSRDERREGAKVMLQALAEKRIGRRDQANAWIWRLAEYTREVHEEYAVAALAGDQAAARPARELVSGGAHARNARRLVHAARKQDRRLQAALLAAAVAHTPEAEEVLRGARTRMARKPSALSRELLRNFPKGKGRALAPPAQEGGRGGRGPRRSRGRSDRRSRRRTGTDGRRRRGHRTAPAPEDDAPSATATTPRRQARTAEDARRKDADPGREADAQPEAAQAAAAPPRAAEPSARRPGEEPVAPHVAAAADEDADADSRRLRRGRRAATKPAEPERQAPPPAQAAGTEGRRRLAGRRAGRLPVRSGASPVRRIGARGAPRRRPARCARRRRARPRGARRRRSRPRAPSPAGPATSRPQQRVARAPGVEQRRPASSASARSSAASSVASERLDVGRRRRPSVAGGGVQLGRQVLDAHRDVDADAEHRPALLRAALGEDARRPCGRRRARRWAT